MTAIVVNQIIDKISEFSLALLMAYLQSAIKVFYFFSSQRKVIAKFTLRISAISLYLMFFAMNWAV